MASKWPLAARPARLRLAGLVLVTAPLFGLLWFLAQPVVDRWRLLEARTWPDVSIHRLAELRRTQAANALARRPPAPVNPDLPVFELVVHQVDRERLDRNLPRSGRREVPAVLVTPGGFQRIKARYRGDMAYHWFFPKKSWRIKTRRDEPLPYGRKIHLINPRVGHVLHRPRAKAFARRLDLLHAPSTPALLNLNGAFAGVVLAQPSVDESLIRAWRRMPSELFKGDLSPRVTLDLGLAYFSAPEAWERVATSGREVPPGEDPPLSQLLRSLHEGTYWDAPRRTLDEPYMQRFCALVTILGARRYDEHHNLLLYLDPLRGQLQMVERDTGGGPTGRPPDFAGLDVASNLLFERLLQNPRFVAAKNALVLERLSDPEFFAGALAEIEALGAAIAPWVERDRLDRQSFNFPAPTPYAAALAEYRAWLTARREHLLGLLGQAELSWAYAPGATARLALFASGNAPSDQVQLRFSGDAAGVRVHEDRDGDGALGPADRLLPARSEGGGVTLQATFYPGRRGGPRWNAPQGRRQSLEPAPLAYPLLVSGLPEGVTLEGVSARNALTGKAARVRRSPDWRVPHQLSRHPWTLPDPPAGVHELAGDVLLERDLIVREGQTLRIAPGTRLRLAPGVSLLSYGRVEALGSEAAPIRVERADPARPWGVFALNAAHGSRFERVTFAGGSAARLERVDYLGMVDLHLARDVRLEACTFQRNSVGDDLVRGAGCTDLAIVACTFEDARSDALDLDYCEGVVADSRFLRSGNDAIDLMSCSPLLTGNRIEGAGDKGISIGEGSAPLVVDTEITGAEIGVEIKDGSRPRIVASRLEGRLAVHAYAKNWRYADGGHGWLVGCALRGREAAIELSPESDLQLEGCAAQGELRGAIHQAPPSGLLAQLGLSDPGAPGRGRRPTRDRVLARVTFAEDLTTNLAGWTLSAGGRAPRWSKTRRGLSLRRGPSALTLSRPPLPGAERLVLELRATPPCALRLQGAEVQIPSTWATLSVPLSAASSPTLLVPHGRGRVEVRLAELRGPQ